MSNMVADLKQQLSERQARQQPRISATPRRSARGSRRWFVVAAALAWSAIGLRGQPAAASGGRAEPAAEEKTDAAGSGVSEPSADGSRTVRLGEFNIRVYHGTASRKDNLAFVLYTVVKKDDFAEFERIYNHNKMKVRDQVIVATRLVSIDDYDDPELKKFRRRIFLRIRRALPELPIEDVYFSDFSLMSQTT